MLYQGYTLDHNVVDKLKQQITNQRNNVSFADGKTLADYWRGGVDRDWATEEMAKMLASSGVTSIDQVGLVKKASPYYGIVVTPIYQNPARTEITGYRYEGDSGNAIPIERYIPASGPIVAYTATLNQPTYDENGYQTNAGEYIELTPQELSTIPSGELARLQSGQATYVSSVTRYVDAVGNKSTGQPLLPWDHARGGLDATTWASTTAGKDNSYFKVAFDQNTGLPLFYTAPKEKGDAFSQFTSMLKQAAPALSIAMMAVPGVGQALGSTLLGAVGATELAANAAIAAAVGNAVVTTVLTGSPKAGINSAIGSYVGQGIASQIGDLATSAAGKQLVESMSSAATRSLITGRNSGEILQDTIAAGIGSAGRLLLESSPWGSTSGLSNETKAALSTAVSTALQGEGNLSEKLAKAAQEGAITYGLSQLNTGGITISPTTQNILNKTLGAALSGKPITPALVSAAVSSVNTELNGVLSKKAELEKHITSGAAQNIINTAMNSASAFWTGEFDSVNTYLNQAIAVANQISQTVARVQGVDVNRADRVQVTNLLNQADPLRATYNYAVNNDPNFITAATKRFDADAAAGKTPDYGAMDLLIKDLSRYDEVKRLNPDFNPDDYRAINQLNVKNPYEHYLTTGRKEGLIGSKIENVWRTSLEKSRLLGEAAQLIGVGVNELSPETRQALSTAIDQKFADPRDYKEMAETSLRNWDDVAGLKLAPARLATLKSGEGMRIEVSGAGIKAVESFEFGPDDKLAAMGYRRQADIDADIAKGNAELQKYFGKSITDKVRIGTTEDMARGVGKFIEIPDTNTRAYVVAVAPDADLDAVPSDNLARLDALANAPVSYFDGDAQLRDYFKGIVDKAKGAALNTPAVQLLQFAGNAIEKLVPDTAKGVGMKAAANVIQSFNGLVTLAGINPSSTPVGKFAEQLMELGKAKTSAEYRAAVSAMEANLEDAKGAWGAAQAIWGNFVNYPIEFLSEVVISEGLQEAVPLLIGGGATVAARGLALARGMGTKLAQQMGARAGLAAGAVSDIAESVGGSAGNAFEEAYDIAKNKMGKSEAEATEIALNIAARSGLISGMVTGLSLKLGGGALEKAVLGGSGEGKVASALNEMGRRLLTGGKILIKEGVSEGLEEGITSAYTEGQLYQLDPTRDVAANIATSSILGAVAGGGIAGSAYGASTGRDIIANALAINPQVQQTIQSAPNIAEAQKALGDLGISNAAVQTDLLNNKFDGQVVSSNEAYSALRNNTGYTPTDADVAALSGVRPEANLQNDALQYIDPRMVDEAEVRQAMQALGYSSPTNEEVAQYLGQRNEASTLGDINQTFDPKAIDAGEAEAALRAAGYTPTAEEVASFTGAKPEADLAGDVQRFVDPRQVTEAEVRQALKDVGYDNPTVEDIAPYLGQKNQAQTLQNAASVFDAKVIDADEAAAALRDRGYKPLPEEIAQFTGVKPESGLSAAIDEYINPREVTRDEARKVFTDLGYTPSEEEISAYVRTPKSDVSQSAVEKQIAEYTDPRVIDAKEAEAALKEAGYKSPTAAEISKFTGVKPESGLKSDVQSYVDPRQVTEAEVRKAFEDLGYTPTKEEIAQYVRDPGATVSQTDIEKQIGAYADPMAVDKAEAKAALEAAGFKNPTDEEINRLVGQYPEADLAGKTKDLSDTLQIERVVKDIADVQAKIGTPNTVPTADDVLRAQRIAVGMVPGVGRTSDAPGFDKNYDVTGDGRVTAADALKLSKMAKGMDVGPLPAGLKWEAPTGLYKRMFDVETAVKNIQFPDTLSEEDVRNIVDDAFDKNPGLTETDVTRVVNDALTKLPAAPTKQDVLDAVNEGIGARSVADDPNTPENEAKEATGLYRDIERLEFALNNIEFPPSLTEEQVRKIVQDTFDANPGLSDQDVTNAIDAALDKLPAAPTLEEINTAVAGQIGARSVKDDPSTPQDESKEATGIYREIERIEKAIEGIEIPPSLTEKQVKDIVAGVFEENPGLSPDDVKGIVNTALDALPVAPTLAEISQEVDSIVGAPSVKDDPTTPENEAREATGVYRAIEATAAGVESRLGAAIADAKAAGLEGDAALDAAIKKVALQLGTSETTLLAKIGKTAEDLSRDFAAQLETVTGQITTVEQAIGKPASVDANGNPVAATGLYAEIAKNEAAGMTREAATQKAIADLSKQLGASETAIKNALAVTESTLGGRITTVEQAIGAPESVDANGNKIPATGIFAEIAKNEAAGMSRDAATQKAITDLSGQLGVAQETILGELSKAETRFGTALAGVQTALTGQITAAQNQIMERMAVYEQAGIDRDTALNLAIQDVSSKLGGQITGLEQLVGKPTTKATQGDIDAINQMIAGTKPMDLSYDITGDKTVDAKDIDALQRWLASTDTEQFPEGVQVDTSSRWAPTGLYGELANATRAQQAAAKAQTEQVLRGQRQANVMQMLGLIGQEPAGGAQQVTVKAPDPAKIGYIYDWSSIFANPQQQQMFASPFAEGGEVADTDELIAILRGSHG